MVLETFHLVTQYSLIKSAGKKNCPGIMLHFIKKINELTVGIQINKQRLRDQNK